MHANLLALHGIELIADGVTLTEPELIGGSASRQTGEDASYYAGLQTFELYAEPA